MTQRTRKQVKQRARQIKKASKTELSTKDYLQRALVVLVILAILAGALLIYQNINTV